MFLKSLVLKGFKTFADRTELTFEDNAGITAIVGPNGCGKSNVVDAFRFVLGEGNFRELRVNTLPEVIFAGTSARKPLSLAEINLVFDNSQGKLPIEYSEVQVRRRTYRDGLSEFTINNQACRLKDIRDLFLDTGLSVESMSIIGQGRVDAILSSHPEERRVIFEEVAGILKYKTRKLEVERKLIVTEQNLLRISDLKVEVSEQALNLEVQAQKAREYKELQTKLKNLELSVFKKQLAGLLAKKTESEDRVAALRHKEQDLESRLKQAQEERMKLISSLKALEVESETVIQKIEELSQKLEAERSGLIIERERALFEERNRLRDVSEECRFLEFELKKIADETASLKGKKAELNKKIRDWSESLAGDFGDLQATIALIDTLIQQINQIAEGWFGHRAVTLPSQAEDHILGMLKEELSRLEEQGITLNDGQTRKQDELARLLGRLAELKQAVEMQGMERSGEEPESLKNLKQEKARLHEKSTKLKEEREQVQKRLEELESGPQIEKLETSDLLKEEVALARISSEIEQIMERIQAEYGLNSEELLALDLMDIAVARGKKEAEEIRARLRELEPVNLLAIEEYEKVKERSGFIENQYADLNTARENLKNLISELDLIAREDFVATIQKISANFSETFAALFAGGEGKIELEEGKDPLEAGIEILVSPSKRKWLNLSLMSGGERALTAIAILFACLKTQPSPLCILDEVDAALDDANVGRFAAFLADYKKQTQIIVITHNKRTMEVADVIYGITMEEPGISKLVSMRLEKV